MKKILIFSVIAIFYGASAQDIIPSAAEIHPAVYGVIENYPPLQKGGYRIEKYGDEQYIIVGIGKAKISDSFLETVRKAEVDAELQIGKALNYQQIIVETSRSKKSETSSVNGVSIQNLYKKFVKILVSAHTPFITSCGFWKNGKNLYCARAVFIGNFNHFAKNTNLSNKITNLSAKEGNNQILETVDNLSFLSTGGTILLELGDSPYLVTVAIVPAKNEPHTRLTFARNQAYKNMMAFISGGKLDNQLITIKERFSINNSLNKSQQQKRKNLAVSIKGHFQYIEPIAHWEVPDTNSVFFLYAVKFDITKERVHQR